MKRTTIGLIITGGLAAVVAATAFADENGRGPRGEEFRKEAAERYFEMFDADNDGKVSKAEVDAFKAARFSEADANNDGKVTMKELETFHEAERARREEERKARMFARIDADGDGALSQTEFMDLGPDRFDRMDSDDSGYIEVDELGRRGHDKPRKAPR